MHLNLFYYHKSIQLWLACYFLAIPKHYIDSIGYKWRIKPLGMARLEELVIWCLSALGPWLASFCMGVVAVKGGLKSANKRYSCHR